MGLVWCSFSKKEKRENREKEREEEKKREKKKNLEIYLGGLIQESKEIMFLGFSN